MVLVIDNYDSFTYNLVQYLGELGAVLKVFRNDKINIEGIRKLRPDAIIISPGPGTPSDAGISEDVIRAFSGKVPILGVCLGHQAIGEVFGSRIVRAKNIMHGKTSFVYHNKKDIFRGLPDPFEATRYHSLLIDPGTVDQEILEVTARTRDQEIMGVKHRKHLTYGVQFHPESILTTEGKKLLKNFLDMGR